MAKGEVRPFPGVRGAEIANAGLIFLKNRLTMPCPATVSAKQHRLANIIRQSSPCFDIYFRVPKGYKQTP